MKALDNGILGVTLCYRNEDVLYKPFHNEIVPLPPVCLSGSTKFRVHDSVGLLVSFCFPSYQGREWKEQQGVVSMPASVKGAVRDHVG